MKVADRDGLQALSMRRLAKELGVEAMSLYHHLPGKDGLLDSLVEALCGEITDAVDGRAPRQAGDWKSDLRSRCLVARSVVLRHPWTPALFASRQSIPSSVFMYVDQIVALMVDAGFTYQITHRALHALGSMMFGFAHELFRPPSSGGKLDVVKPVADLEMLVQQLPHLGAMISSEIHQAGDPTVGWCDSQTEFEFTLDLLLDGLEKLRGPGQTPH